MIDAISPAALWLSAFPFSTIAKSAILLAVALLAVKCARSARAATRHLILASAFAVVLALPVMERAVPAVTLSVAPSAATDNARTLPIVMAAEFSPAGLADPAPTQGTDARGSETARPSVGALVCVVWATGAGICLIPVLMTPWRLRAVRRTARRWPEGDELTRSIASGDRRSVTVLNHDNVAAPLTCGIVWPVIVLPSQALAWTDQEVRQALTHELEHVRRADWPVHIAARTVCALHWFNPLVWIAWHRLSLEAERACDDAVLRMAESESYAQQLVTLARRARTSPVPVLSMVDRSELSVRISALLDDAQVRGRVGFGRASMILAMAALVAAAVVPLRAATQASVQAPDPATLPSFDVVSVKENKSGDTGQRMQRQPGRIVASNFLLRPLLQFVFGLQPQQLVGGPDWLDSVRFDITASMSSDPPMTPPGVVGPVQLMLQRVFAERFGLAVHKETRELPIYALTLARSDGTLGRGIKTATTDCDAVMNALLKSARLGGPPPQAPRLPDGSPACGMMFGPNGILRAGGITMPLFAQNLSAPAGRIVVDKTGLSGAFDLVVEYTPDPASPGPPPLADSNNPAIFTALEEQLGLKLQPQRGPIEVLVIDRVQRPTEN